MKRRVCGAAAAALLVCGSVHSALAADLGIFQGHIADSMLVEEESDIIQGHIVDGSFYNGIFTVTFVPNGEGAVCDRTEKRVTNGHAYGILPIPQRSGYAFLGWISRESGQYVSANTVVRLTGDETLYAQWEPISYTVTLDPCGGIIRDGTQSVAEGGFYGELPSPLWGGHVFAGWYTSAAGGTRIENGSRAIFSGDHTLYAHWEKVEPASARPAGSDPASESGRWYAASSAPADSGAEENWISFSDVPPSAPFYEAVNWAVRHGVTSGTSPVTFSPNDPCKSKHMITFLWRANGSPDPLLLNAPEGTVNNRADKAAVWAFDRGLISPGTYREEAAATRAEAVTYLWKLAGSPVVDRDALNGTLRQFSDVSADSPCAQAVAWAVKRGVTNGTTPTTFSPGRTCTRGQIVTFLFRCCAV